VSLCYHDFKSVPPWACEWEAPTTVEDLSFMERMKRGYKYFAERSGPAVHDMWEIVVTGHKHFLELLLAGDYTAAERIIGNLYSSSLSYFFHQGHEVASALHTNQASRDHMLMYYADKLLLLAEYVRAIPLYNAEQGSFDTYPAMHPDEIVALIEGRMSIGLAMPSFQGGLWGIKSKCGLLTDRTLTAYFVANRIDELVKNKNARICEIGGGAGHLAYFCHRFGLKDYTIVDLPSVATVQSYVMMRNLGPDSVAFGNEPARNDVVKLIPTEDFHDETKPFDLIVNIDSLPEMGTAVATRYLKKISDFGAPFLSINQEALHTRTHVEGDIQERVPDLIDKMAFMPRNYRAPFWMRPGYVEELYM
jgi:hypothetical protein